MRGIACTTILLLIVSRNGNQPPERVIQVEQSHTGKYLATKLRREASARALAASA